MDVVILGGFVDSFLRLIELGNGETEESTRIVNYDTATDILDLVNFNYDSLIYAVVEYSKGCHRPKLEDTKLSEDFSELYQDCSCSCTRSSCLSPNI